MSNIYPRVDISFLRVTATSQGLSYELGVLSSFLGSVTAHRRTTASNLKTNGKGNSSGKKENPSS